MPDRAADTGTNQVSRRDFLLAAGVVAAAASPVGQAGGDRSCHLPTPGQRPTSYPSGFELEDLPISSLQQGLKSGRWTSADLVRSYLDRIASIDRAGPVLRHVLDVNPDAVTIAEALDRERRSGGVRGPMHGIPVLLKDNIDTGDRMTTTAGSLALEGTRAGQDAFLAGRLRAAGAILLAKTNMSEWANFRSSRSSSGWSSRGGQGKNPYALDRTPCGSSSGTGGAIASSCAAVGLGTETDGSVTCPASAVSLVGLKPTVGLLSRSGIIPISHTQDTAGPMTRTVEDAAVLLAALVGEDPRDPATAGQRVGDYLGALDRDALRGARLGVPRKHFTGYDDDTDRLFDRALDVMRQAGAEIVDPVELLHAGEYDDAEFQVLLYEFKADLNAYLAGRDAACPMKSLADIIAFNQRERDRVMPYFAQEIMIQAEAKGPLTEVAYKKALKKCRLLSRAQGIDAVMTRHRLDALVAPTGNPAWPIDVVNGDHFTGSVTTPAAVAGYPHITVPGGYVYGLPVGVSFFGRAWSEARLLGLGYAFEQATRHRHPPAYLATADVGAGVEGTRATAG
jgi:amidase